MVFNVTKIRESFPSLESGTIFFDNPGGTQTPQQVISAMENYFLTANANRHGMFATSQKTEEILENARQAFADFINANSSKEIYFGANMTTLTYSLSRALSRNITAGDEVIVCKMDHDANIAPWLDLAEKGAVIKWIEIDKATCEPDVTEFEKLLNAKTKIVAFGAASNAVGTFSDFKKIISLAHKAGAIVFLDAVQMAPHAGIDVQALDCDFLALSVYKFFGPHIGVIYGKQELLENLVPYKIRPHSDETPDKFETGTQNHEGIAGALAAIEYLATIGESYGKKFQENYKNFTGRRLKLKTALATIKEYEKTLCTELIQGLQNIQGVKVYGITDAARFDMRAPTVSFTVPGIETEKVAAMLAEKNINVSNGHFNAYETMKHFGLDASGGTVRAGLSHYNTSEEIKKFLAIVGKIAEKA